MPDDPPSNRVDVGAYAFPAAGRNLLEVEESERGEYELTDILAKVVSNHDGGAVDVSFWKDVGRPWELLEAKEWTLDEIYRRIDGDVHADADVRGAVVVEFGARIDAGAVVEGPALSGPVRRSTRTRTSAGTRSSARAPKSGTE
jgi:dTDP-glucose pyrophosphorylase